MPDAASDSPLGSALELHHRGDGPAVVLVHALGSSRQSWDGLTSLLADCTLITYDLPGHGERAAPSKSYRIRDLADELDTALAAAEIDQVYVLGMSLGGLVAQELVARSPERIAGLILIDAVARYPDPVRQAWIERARTARESGMQALVGPTLATWFTAETLAAGGPIVDAVEAALRATPAEGYALACEALERADTQNLLASIAVPTLIVCGSDDLPHFTAAATMLTDSIAPAELVWLTPARHASALEQPAQFAAAVRDFIARTAAPMTSS